MPDWDVEEVAGAYLFRAPPQPAWVCIGTALSADQETLVRVFEMPLGFRVETLKKKSGTPELNGLWWSEVAPAVGAASREEAMRFMTEFLHGKP